MTDFSNRTLENKVRLNSLICLCSYPMYNSSVFGANTPSWVSNAVTPARPKISRPVFDFEEARTSLRKRQIHDQYFVDFYADANLGERLFELVPLESYDQVIANTELGTLERNDVCIPSPRRFTHNVNNTVISFNRPDGVKDFSLVNVRIGRSLNTRRFYSIYTGFSIQDISELITVGNHMYDLANSKSEARFHYFPRAIWGNMDTEDMCDILDSMLAQPASPIIYGGYGMFLAKYTFCTFGQQLYAMIYDRMVRNNFKCTLNLRLMILVLSRMANSRDDEWQYLLSQLFYWLVVDMCDSCLEKIIYFDLGYDNNLYDMLSYPANQYAAISVADFDAQFVTFECKVSKMFESTVIPRLTHSGISVRAHRDVSSIVIWSPDSDQKTICKMPTCYCIIVKTLSELIVRACRGASLGRNDIVLDWFKLVYKRNGDLDLIDQYMVKLVLMYKFLPGMQNTIRNYFLVLYYGIISDNLLNSILSPTSFNDVAASLLKVEPQDRRGVLQYCFRPETTLSQVQEFLISNERHRVLIDLITRDISNTRSE